MPGSFCTKKKVSELLALSAPDWTTGGSASRGSGRRRGAQLARLVPPEQRSSVQRLTERVDHATNPAVIRRDFRPAQQFDRIPDRHPFRHRIRQDHRTILRQSEDLSAQITGTDQHSVPQRRKIGQTRDKHGATGDLGDTTNLAEQGYTRDFGTE